MPLAFARSILTGGSSKSFTLTRSASTINEGSSVTFTLNSSGLAGESIPYTITGITDSDISSGSLTGNIIINGDETGSASVTTKSDFHTEGAENLTFTIGSAYQQYADSNGYTSSVTINDTSLTPRVDSITRSASSVNEGSYVDLTFNTSNCRTNAGTAGTRIYFKITGIQAADISSVSGTASSGSNGPPPVNASTIATEYGYVVTNNTSSPFIRLNMNADELTEGSQTLTCTVTRLYDYQGPGDGTVAVDGSTSQTVTINDTSIAHPVGQFFVVPGTSGTSTGGTQPSYGYEWGNNNNYNPNANGNKTNQNTNTVTNYNWTVPSGVSDIAVAVVSAGGSGPFGSQNAYSGGGGGGGGLGAAKFTGLQGGQSYLLTVGKAGNVGKSSGNSWFRSSNVRQSIYVSAGRSPGINVGSNANLGASAQHSDSQSNSNSGRAGGTVQFGNTYDSGVGGGQGQFTRHEGAGGAGGRGYYFNVSQAAGGGGGAGGWGRTNYGQSGNGGQGGRAVNVNGTAGNNGAGGGGGSSNSYGGSGGGVGLAGPGQSGNGGSGNFSGNAGSPWGGYEYGYGGGGGSPNQSGVSGGCGAIRVVWTSGATWE